MVESIENRLYDNFGLIIPEGMLGNQVLLARLEQDVLSKVPRTVFDNLFDKSGGTLRRGGYPWEVRMNDSNVGYELVPPTEYYVVNFKNRDGVMVPEHALLKGGTIAVDFQWDNFQGAPWLRLFDISCAGTSANKTRFHRDNDDPRYFKPNLVGANLQNTNLYKPQPAHTILPCPRLVYDFPKSALQTQRSTALNNIRTGEYIVGSAGQQIIFPGASRDDSVPSIHFFIEQSNIDYVVNAIPGDKTIGTHLSIPVIVEDLGCPHIDIRSMDEWIGNLASIVIQKYPHE